MRTQPFASRIATFLLLTGLFVIAGGCSLAPVKPELALATGKFFEPATVVGTSRVVFVNGNPGLLLKESELLEVSLLNTSLFKAFGTGKLNVSINGKGFAQIDIGEYAQIMLPMDDYEVTLVHKDMFDFTSKHRLTVKTQLTAVGIWPTEVSNGLQVIDMPTESYMKSYKEVKINQ